jgi:rRNA maturation endonuclease Nob1
MKENYLLTCDGCDSRFEIICYDVTYEYEPEYCPFCGSLIDENEDEEDPED